MYIAELGLTYEEFTEYTATSGSNARSASCKDNYGNCPDLAKGCCFNRRVGGGRLLEEACCDACMWQNENNKDQCRDDSNNCFDQYNNCDELATNYSCERDDMKRDCCKSCKNIFESGAGRTDGATGCSDKFSECTMGWVESGGSNCDTTYEFSDGVSALRD